MTRARDLADSADKDIVGTLTLDGLTVDGNVGIGTSSPARTLHVTRGDGTGTVAKIGNTGTSSATIEFSDTGTTDTVSIGSVGNDLTLKSDDGDISLNTTGDPATASLYVERGGNVGIGTSAPSLPFHLQSGSNNSSLARFTGAQLNRGLTISTYSSGGLNDGGVDLDAEDSIRVSLNGEEKFKVDATGTTVTSGTLTATALNLTRTTDLTLSSTPALVIGPSDGTNIAMDTNEISARNNGAGADLLLNHDTGQGAVRINSSLYLTGTKISTTSNTLDLSVDDDGSGSNQQIRFIEGGVVRMVLEDNDLYVHDNINAGRKAESGGSNQVFDTTSSHVSAYSADTVDGSGIEYRTFIQSYNTTDPDVAVFQCFSKDVMDDTGITSHDQRSTAHILDNGGRAYSWSAQYAGRVRVGSTASTNAYRAGDSNFTAYSGTGNAHGHTSSAGYTQIIGRETANSDIVFQSVTGSNTRHRFTAAGDAFNDGTFSTSNADYAEFFEWADGNPDNEDRRGHAVVLTTDGKIRIATTDDDTSEFLGIISVESGIVGDSAWSSWTGMHERDRFGQIVYEDYDLLCWGPYDEDSQSYKTQTTRQAMIDAGREADIPEDAITVTKSRKKFAADYDPDREYIARSDRPEWSAVGLMGKLPLLKGQPTAPQWRKLFDLNDEVEMWLVR